MSYILKNTSGLVNTRLTDTGRLKLSQGNFNISYFQIGDSEVSYNTLTGINYNQGNNNILEPAFNSQNSSGAPEKNKQNIKYPYYVTGSEGNTYGIPFMESSINPIFNRAAMRGFFNGDLTANTINWSARTNSQYVINSNFVVDMSGLTGGTIINLINSQCNSDIIRMPSIGDIITIFYDGNGDLNCSCTVQNPTPTPTHTMTPTPSYNACELPLPTPTPTSTCCVTPTPSSNIPTPLDCEMSMSSCYTMLTYKIVDICFNAVTLDRPTPDFSYLSGYCLNARVLIYPPNMISLYDSYTPMNHWNQNVIDFESICSTDEFDVKIWNMNIPWSESPAGLIPPGSLDYPYFGSSTYLGTKEYLGYASSSGQTDTSKVYYNNSLGQEIDVEPADQKAIAIIHYTNQTIDFFYGEKFAFQPHDPSNPLDTTGEARNFRLHIPWLMWHKSTNCCLGQTFYVDPPGFDNYNLFQPYYTLSTKNSDMAPGIRYYHLWDTNPNILTGFPNRIGKVYPDQKIIVIDDEEIIAAMSYKSNRNWTLPAPQISLTTPNTFGSQDNSSTGLLTNTTEYLYLTYRFGNSSAYTESLHCNYYSKIQGPDLNCGQTSAQNVAVRFGSEFSCLNQISEIGLNNGFFADTFEIICQKVSGNIRPSSSEWVKIDLTNQLSATTINNYLTQSGLTGTTFVITQDMYDNGSSQYNLNNYPSIAPVSGGTTGQTLNFGDEYYFYGSIETDIEATIYEMKYKVNLGQADFQSTSNPTWSKGTNSFITEIGLYDDEKNLMIISKLQSPVLRQGIQQFLVKFDF